MLAEDSTVGTGVSTATLTARSCGRRGGRHTTRGSETTRDAEQARRSRRGRGLEGSGPRPRLAALASLLPLLGACAVTAAPEPAASSVPAATGSAVASSGESTAAFQRPADGAASSPDGPAAKAPTELGTRFAAVAPRVVDVDALPRIDVAPWAGNDPFGGIAALPAGAVPARDVLTRGRRVTLLGHTYGSISVSGSGSIILPFGDGGTTLFSSHGRYVLAWESFDALPDGAVAVEWMHGIYDVDVSRAFEVWRAPSARAVPLAGGAFYAFRTSCAACAPGAREELHVLMPGGLTTQITGKAVHVDVTSPAATLHVAMSLDSGTSASLQTSIDRAQLAEWRKRMPKLREGARAKRIGIEATGGSASAHPVVIAYVD
jgi:hypothetical protein